jgi:MFS transporter, DHA1 family, multidrug resistance protein
MCSDPVPWRHPRFPSDPPVKLRFGEFVALIAALMSCQALAVDAMLPALAAIVNDLGISDANRAQWVISFYVGGMGAGQLFWGVLSDRYGRRPVLLAGLIAYGIAAALCARADMLSELLAWRALHGLAASSIVVARSVIRDLYEGRRMARVMSLTFIVFLLVPMLAPAVGQLILTVGDWRELFFFFTLFAAAVGLWMYLRLPETLHPEYRMTLTAAHVFGAIRRVLTERASFWYTIAMVMTFGSILAYVGMVQQIFQDVFQRPEIMPAMFGVSAAVMGVGSFVNSAIVERYGMRRVSQGGLAVFLLLTALHTAIAASGEEPLWLFVTLQSLTMASMGLMGANFGAMALESMAPIAGVAASLQGSISSVGGALIGALIGLFFVDSVLPLPLGALLCGSGVLACVLIAEQGRLWRPHSPDPVPPQDTSRNPV